MYYINYLYSSTSFEDIPHTILSNPIYPREIPRELPREVPREILRRRAVSAPVKIKRQKRTNDFAITIDQTQWHDSDETILSEIGFTVGFIFIMVGIGLGKNDSPFLGILLGSIGILFIFVASFY